MTHDNIQQPNPNQQQDKKVVITTDGNDTNKSCILMKKKVVISSDPNYTTSRATTLCMKNSTAPLLLPPQRQQQQQYYHQQQYHHQLQYSRLRLSLVTPTRHFQYTSITAVVVLFVLTTISTSVKLSSASLSIEFSRHHYNTHPINIIRRPKLFGVVSSSSSSVEMIVNPFGVDPRRLVLSTRSKDDNDDDVSTNSILNRIPRGGADNVNDDEEDDEEVEDVAETTEEEDEEEEVEDNDKEKIAEKVKLQKAVQSNNNKKVRLSSSNQPTVKRQISEQTTAEPPKQKKTKTTTKPAQSTVGDDATEKPENVHTNTKTKKKTKQTTDNIIQSNSSEKVHKKNKNKKSKNRNKKMKKKAVTNNKSSALVTKHLQTTIKTNNPNYRIQRELRSFVLDPPDNLRVAVGSNIRIWIVTMKGAKNTIYEGEIFKLRIRFPDQYPAVPPSVYFLPPNIPVHEHVYTNGDICLSLLGKDWRPTMTAQSIAVSILSILSSAQSKSLPMDNARHAQNDPGQYQKDWVYHDDNC